MICDIISLNSANILESKKQFSKSKGEPQSQRASAKLGEMFEELNLGRREFEFKSGPVVEPRFKNEVQRIAI